jgi:vitamin B12 transporter
MNSIQSRPTTAVTAVIMLLTTPIAAAASQDDPPDMEHLVVTASRHAESIFEASGSVSVITAEDIQRSAAEDLVEVLRLQAGVDIVRTGGAGAQTSVFLRGSNSNHILVLVDGVRVASPHTGAYAWEQLPLNQVERIEIVRGPRASVYGSDAIGGVIQVFTRPEKTTRARLTAGSHGTRELEAGLRVGGAAAGLSLSAARRETDGFSSQNPGGFSYHPDDDGLVTSNASINGDLALDNGSLGFRLLASRNETEFDEGVSEARQTVAAVTWENRLKPGWEQRLQLGLTDDELASDYGFFTTGFSSSRHELSWHHQLKLQTASLGFGLDYHDDSGDSRDSYSADRHNTGAYLILDRPTRLADVQVSARLDDNSEFGDEFTWQVATSLDIGPRGRITGMAGTAFRAPSLSEQFSPGFGGLFAGNPQLLPETATAFELLYRHRPVAGSQWSVSAYQNRVKQLITFSGQDFAAINLDRARLRGVEAEYTRFTASWKFSINASLQDAEDRATSEALLRRPRKKAALEIDRTFANGAWAGLDWFVSGDRLDVASHRLPGYGILSLRGGLPIAPNLQIELRVENLLDRDYEPVAGFNSPGRSGFLSLHWRP